MRMTIRYEGGLRVEAILLAASRERMRIIADSERDTAELHKVDTRWFTEDGAAVEIEALIPLDGTETSQFCAELYPRTALAGGDSHLL